MAHQPANAHSPRVVVAAPQGRSGKTTLSLGICAALAARGLVVQPFKKGPDYIDPSWLSAAAGRACRSLDPFFLSAQAPDEAGLDAELRSAFWRGARGADFSLVEGNHGLYDGQPLGEWHGHRTGAVGSTAAVARALSAPVLLVVNAARMSRSVAAMISGYQHFEPDTPIEAVILNNVAHSRHESKLRAAIESYCRLPVVGALPRDEALTIPDRHLGLVPQTERTELNPALQACRQAAERYLDLDAILGLAQAAPALPIQGELATNDWNGKEPLRLGVLRDQAFSFYYPENLAALEQAGAQLIFIDAVNGDGLPPVDGLYIGGGFPEVFMHELEANAGLRAQIRQAAAGGLPIYAECGGLMYLSQRVHWQGRSVEMAGVLPCEVALHEKPQGHGYVLAKVSGANPFFAPGTRLRGHEFHHSQIINLDPKLQTAYHLERGSGLGSGRDGLVVGNVLAAYTHLHADGSPDWAPALVACARAYAHNQKRTRIRSGSVS